MPLLETRDVVVRFGGVVAVNEASIQVEAGRVAGLIGPNGAGKTTTFNVISGLQDATSGVVLLDDEDITNASVQKRARRGIARTFQRLEVFSSLSVRDNVRVSAEIHRSWSGEKHDIRASVDSILKRVGIQRFANVPADAVPTGIARLTELARALAIRPRILLLDEPSSGLNEEETDEFGELLIELAGEGMAILMVEHDVDLVMSTCSWIDVLDFGRIIASGTPEEIRSNELVQSAYLGQDTGGEEDAA